MQTDVRAFPFFYREVDQLTSLQVAVRHNRVCHHTAEDIAPLVAMLEREHSDRGTWPVRLPGLEYLGAGTDKVTYALECGFHVLKLSKGYDYHGNQLSQEIDVWNESESNPLLRQYLCPIDAYTNNWIIARRADCSDKAMAAIELTDAAPGRFPDCHNDNIGRVAGRPVLIDYGIWKEEKYGRIQDWGVAVFVPAEIESQRCKCQLCRAERGSVDEPESLANEVRPMDDFNPRAAFEAIGFVFVNV